MRSRQQQGELLNRGVSPAHANGLKRGPKGSPPTRQRYRYFKVCRPERTALSMMENTYIMNNNYKEYRACRFLYYVMIPYLQRNISYLFDRRRIVKVESLLWNQLLLYHHSKDRIVQDSKRVRVTFFRYLGSPDQEDPLTAKL